MIKLDDDIKTPYQFFEKRYSNKRYVRVITAFIGLLFYFLFLTLYLYGCSVILKQLIPTFPLWSFSIIVGVYSMIGSAIGGFTQTTKTNLFQFSVIIIGLITAIVLTFSKFTSVMSFGEIIDFAAMNKRFMFFDFNIDLTTRYTIFNQLISLPIPWMCFHSLLLPNFIRYRSIKGSIVTKRLVAISNFPTMFLFNTIGIICGGICCFLYFYGCNPIYSDQIDNINLIGTYWFFSIFTEKFPVFTGVLFASIMSFSIVQHSLGVALCANTIYGDILEPILFLNVKSPNVVKKIKLLIAVCVSVISIAFSVLFKHLKNSTASLFFLFNNSTNSPIMGLFILSILNPYANHIGAMTAFLLNISINYWLVLGSLNIIGNNKPRVFPETDTTLLCDNWNSTSNLTLASIEIEKRIDSIDIDIDQSNITTINNQSIINNFVSSPQNFVYSISPIWYCLFSLLFNLIFGSLFSLLYSLIKTKTIDSDSDYKEKRKNYLFFYYYLSDYRKNQLN
jgi:Na+/proline symporter